MYNLNGFILWADKINLELVDTEAFSRKGGKGHRYQSLVTYVRGWYGSFVSNVNRVVIYMLWKAEHIKYTCMNLLPCRSTTTQFWNVYTSCNSLQLTWQEIATPPSSHNG